MFLLCIGTDALKVYNTFNLAEDDTTKLQDIITKFENFIIGETNETYKRYKFNQRNQLSVETTDQFITALKTLSSTWNFCDCMKESLLRDRLVTGIRNPETRKKLLERRKLTLQDAIDICRATESSASQIKEMDHRQTSSDTINKIAKQPSRPSKVRPTSAQATCKLCGGQHQFLKSKCPAYGKVCSKCGGKQHLAVDSSVAPVIMPDRRVPIAMKAKLKTELGDMVKRGIITPVEEPTPWVSQLVVTPKPNGRLRVCLDPKYLNKALQREHYTMPILDDILHGLSSSKVFTKAD
ncbi:retrovirus-related Pol polyprotein from [Elysia marginata]|uniref:Retrovirus-related Pol polyprotein from n=1 Tax=Elysia marginata TaxID=1093978 RepID=A0AAV4G425_9GAST|nr:retrovirus-related Pol polyprotein from [Elysia marginata]